MLVKIAWIIELIAIIICIHRIYDKKIRVTFVDSIAFILMIIIIDMINYYNLGNEYTLITYLVMFIYCLCKFKEKAMPTFVSCFLSIALGVVIEFGCMLILTFFPFSNVAIRNICGSIIFLAAAIFIIPKLKVRNIRYAILKRHWLTYCIGIFVIIVILASTFTLKKFEMINLGFYIFGIPAIIIMLLMLVYWDKSIEKEKNIKKELCMIKEMQTQYEELIETVRINQHGLKNHLAAFESVYYKCDSSEEIYSEQYEYYNDISVANRFGELLLIDDKILAGFLYAKTLEMEDKGVAVLYKINTVVKGCGISYYYLVEMLGILLDNALESAINLKQKNILFSISKIEKVYHFTVGNAHQEVMYEEMMSWFKSGSTTKGKGRGIGLYRLKDLCKKLNCNILCDNEIIENENWIIFELEVPEKEGDE